MTTRPARRIKGTGRRCENETVICFNDGDAEATISTASPKLCNLLRRRGYSPEEWNSNRARFRLPKTAISVRSAKRLPRTSLDTPDSR
jgi:hypothetical protein